LKPLKSRIGPSLLTCLLLAASGFAGCAGKSAPASPSLATTATTTPAGGTPKLTAPTLASPEDDLQTATLRPVLTVNNGTSDQSGTRTYEFQISDSSSFTAIGGTSYTVAVDKTSVAEDPTGKTSFAPDQDLQPATRFYWRARVTQGSTTSDWSTTAKVRTNVQGFNRPGELYDPLVNGETVANLRFKRTAFVPGKGLRVDDNDSYVRYLLLQTITAGEFSMDLEGISANGATSAFRNDNPDQAKLKVFSMCGCSADFYSSNNTYLCDVQYRGPNGNPDNALQFKCLFGADEEGYKLELDLAARNAAVRLLNAANTYHFKATWANFFRLQVFDGGPGGVAGSGTALGGTQIFDQSLPTFGTYSPNPHFAYLGVNNSGSETGSWPGVIYRNVWIGNKPRPATLGSALRPAS
jgi:hypothetical protein